MRVLIAFALIGACFAEEILSAVPFAYSPYVVDELKPSYEYRTSVQTPTYNNYAHVRSGGEIERKIYNFPVAPAIAAEPILPAAKIYTPLPVAKAVPVATNFEVKPIAQVRSDAFVTKLAPIATPIAAPIATPIAAPVIKSEPIVQPFYPFYRFAPSFLPSPVVAEATPAEIVNTVVENKVVGEGLLTRKSQYHSQNELGEATYGHREQFQAHDAVQDAAGNKAGSFSYIAPDGRLLTTEYVADKDGYRVASNALPIAEKPVVPFVSALPIEGEKPADDAVVVEAKSRSRRSVAIAAPVVPVTRTLPVYTPQTSAIYYQSPYALSYSPYYAYSPYYGSPFFARTYPYATFH